MTTGGFFDAKKQKGMICYEKKGYEAEKVNKST